jgi:Zn-dependent peptidase ImmA (M78 family)
MAGFRLKMATQLGEKTAADAGCAAFPIDPIAIARSKDIDVLAKPSEVKGVSGAMIMAGGNVTILYSSEYNNTGFEHFCVAHELGHYFLPGHPEEIQKQGGTHFSRAGFTQNSSIELEADHFASGLLLPSRLTRSFLSRRQSGLQGILDLANAAECSRTAAAIRSAECCDYPIAVIVSEGSQVFYAFMSDKFKQLGKLAFLRKGSPLPHGATRRFNADATNILDVKRDCASTDLNSWFDGPREIALDEEIIGLGKYGYTLTVLSSEELPADPDEEDDEDKNLEERWTPRFAYGR